MDNNFEHIVYTRCRFGRNINGKVIDDGVGGQGIHVMTKDFVSECRDPNLQEYLLTKRNSSTIKNRRFISSVQYIIPDIGHPILIGGRMRNEEECAAAEEKRVDARYPYINEWYVGNFNVNVGKLIDAPIWGNLSKEIYHYYRNEAPLPLEEPYPAQYIEENATSIDTESLPIDVNVETIKKVFGWVLSQYDLPLDQRKFLVIRAPEGEVRAIIKFILGSLPAYLANQISFNTNMEWPEDDVDTVYSIDKTTHMFTDYPQPGVTERRVFGMIVGVDPNADTSGRLEQVYPTAPYVVVDSIKSNSSIIVSDKILNSRFMNAVFNDRRMIENFISVANKMLPMPLNSRICEIFEAISILQTDRIWDYSLITRVISLLKEYFSPNVKFYSDVLYKLTVEGQYINNYAAQDETNDFKLFRILRELANKHQFRDILEALENIPFLRVKQMLDARLIAEDNFIVYITKLKGTDSAAYQRVIRQIFNDNQLSAFNSQAISATSEKWIRCVFEIIHDYIKFTDNTWTEFINNHERSIVLDSLLKRSVKVSLDGDGVTCAVQLFKSLINEKSTVWLNYALIGVEEVRNSEPSQIRWWHQMMDGGVSMDAVAQCIVKTKCNPNHILELLCEIIEKNGITESTQKTFDAYLSNNNYYTEVYYNSVLDYARKHDNYPKTIRYVLQKTREMTVYRKIVEHIDRMIEFTDSETEYQIAQILRETDVSPSSINRSLLLLYMIDISQKSLVIKTPDTRNDKVFMKKMKEHSERSTTIRNGRIVESLATGYLNCNPTVLIYSIPQNFQIAQSDLGKHFINYFAEKSHKDPFAHFIVSISFNFYTEKELNCFLHYYAIQIAEKVVTKNSDALSSLMFLEECVKQNNQDMFSEDEREILQQICVDTNTYNALIYRFKYLRDVVYGRLSEYKLGSLKDRLVTQCSKKYGEDLAGKLVVLLQNAENEYSKNHPSIFDKTFGMFKSTFGKKK